jgi:S-adenosylmethionine:tRNA ribosyltransferase-isomerase
MQLKDLDFSYPEELVAQTPVRPSRVMRVHLEKAGAQGSSSRAELPTAITSSHASLNHGSGVLESRSSTPVLEEISIRQLLESIPPGDVFVVNDSKVLPRRVFSAEGLEILFIQESSPRRWDVLFPAKRLEKGQPMQLPEGVRAQLVQSGLPQIIEVSAELTPEYFERHGELPLPPYIQKARGERHQNQDDKNVYQPAWAANPGSLASPTASLHFSNEDMEYLRNRGVHVVSLTLHVGLGTFLPIKSDNVLEHQMHAEFVEIPKATWEAIEAAHSRKSKVWALGTTSVRSLESAANGLLSPSSNPEMRWQGFTTLFINPGYTYRVVDRLLTNFHQPKSTLVALVAAFADLPTVKSAYAWAMERRFRLFSYGDLSVWIK